VRRIDFGDAPVFPDRMAGKITDTNARKAFDYWLAISFADKWLALPPETPARLVETYRGAFAKVSTDAQFINQGEHLSDGFVIMNHSDVRNFVQTLSQTPPAAIEYMKTMMKRQGLPIE
jgi:hypothetical protein